jgi:hypothetical protein
MKIDILMKASLATFLAFALVFSSAGCSDSDDDNDESSIPAANESAPASDGESAPAPAPSSTPEATDGGSSPAPQAQHVNVDGDWFGTRSNNSGSTSIQIRFSQNDSILTGAYQDTSGFAGPLAGTIDGDDIVVAISLTQGAPGETWTFSGAANAAGTQLNGQMNRGGGSDNVSATR